MATLALRISGEPRNITVRGFLSALDSWLKILGDLDSAISGEPQGSLDWFVVGLSTGSLAVEVESRSKLEDKNVGPEVAGAFITGLEHIERQGTSPAYLSETGMQRMRHLLRLIGREGAAGITVTHLSQTVEVSARASANIDQLMRVQQRSIGSVEGKLETISIHGRARFVVYHGLTRKAVTCKFDPGRWLNKVKDALGHRVNVSGMVHYNAKSEPLRVELEEIRILREKGELPSTAEISGSDPHFTGDMSTEGYIGSIRAR
ncbi:MAG: hypothetical protein MUP14_03605 [Dehalococcoidia bacterium]|nr:hypothetical protein [Dehalococcoidia bacterium]